MEITTEEPLKIISQLLIPLLIVIVTGLIQICFKIYLSLHEKNKYIKHLKTNFSPVDEFLDKINNFKIINVYILSYMYFISGVLVGLSIELILVKVIAHIFSYVLDTNYIGKLLDLSSQDILLNGVAIFYSSLNIGIFIIIFIFILWCKHLKSKKLFIPKINKYGTVEESSSSVYESFWVFIGIIFGLYLIILFYFTATLYNLSIIDNNLSFNRTQFDLTYPHLLHPEVHIIAYMIGFVASLALISISYYGAKQFKERIIMLITDFYKYDFPYVKIKTESGEIKGQLRDILDKYFITLSENNNIKIVQWDKIVIMEAYKKKNSEHYILNNSKIDY